MDARELRYQNNFFDLAIDKSTLDALLCGEKSFVNVAIMASEVQRVLKQGGIYMIISYGQPENRIIHLERDHLSFDINIFTIKKDYTIEEENKKYEKMHYVYICKKKDLNQNFKEKLEKVLEDLKEEEKIDEQYLEDNCSNEIESNNSLNDEEIYKDELQNLNLSNEFKKSNEAETII